MSTVTIEATGTPLFTAENGGPDFAELAPLVIAGVFPDAKPSVQVAGTSARIVFEIDRSRREDARRVLDTLISNYALNQVPPDTPRFYELR
jgi:hypothetical protein